MDQEDLIQAILESIGFTVEKIPERDVKTPDFHVTMDGDEYTIELKTKFMNPSLLEEMEQSFDEGEVHTHGISLDFNNKYQKVIHNAKKQLETKPIYEDSLHLAWFHSHGQGADLHADLFENTLYGKVTIIDADDSNEKYVHECYFYDKKAMFNRYKDVLDGAVITFNESIKILLNPYSSNYEKFKNSKLATAFKRGVQDPIKQSDDGIGFYLGPDEEDSDRCGILNRKYELKRAMKMPMQMITATVATKKKKKIISNN